MVSASHSEPTARSFPTRCGCPTSEQAGRGGDGSALSQWWKRPPLSRGTCEACSALSSRSQRPPVPPRGNLLNYSLLISFLPFSDSFLHCSSVLPRITFQINYLPHIYGGKFWGEYNLRQSWKFPKVISQPATRLQSWTVNPGLSGFEDHTLLFHLLELTLPSLSKQR